MNCSVAAAAKVQDKFFVNARSGRSRHMKRWRRMLGGSALLVIAAAGGWPKTALPAAPTRNPYGVVYGNQDIPVIPRPSVSAGNREAFPSRILHSILSVKAYRAFDKW